MAMAEVTVWKIRTQNFWEMMTGARGGEGGGSGKLGCQICDMPLWGYTLPSTWTTPPPPRLDPILWAGRLPNYRGVAGLSGGRYSQARALPVSKSGLLPCFQ